MVAAVWDLSGSMTSLRAIAARPSSGSLFERAEALRVSSKPHQCFFADTSLMLAVIERRDCRDEERGFRY